ncbi:MAG: hypothetical protein OEW25_01470 [Nitrospira sp.]|nr:hypothetical protein [Nitrospira sp.]MDH4327981.1 hypothetical protein [Nitrospira sp.]MDH5251967.1 hypothetical protein [Nitrospira sp.]
MGKGNLGTEEGQRDELPVSPRTARLLDELRESSVRHYVWGTVIVMMGLFTLFGIWFLLGG